MSQITLPKIKSIESFFNGNENDPLYKKMKLIENEISDVVDILRKEKFTKNKNINDLMNLFYLLVGNKVTPIIVAPNVKSISIMVLENKNKVKNVLIAAPYDWSEELRKDANNQMGGLVFIASQCKDFFNKKMSIENKKSVENRAASYESELLHYFKETKKEKFVPNSYQQVVMKEFPLGCKSCDSHYESVQFK